MSNDRQAEPEASVLTANRAIGLTKTFEDKGEKLGRNSLPGILNAHYRAKLISFHVDFNSSFRR